MRLEEYIEGLERDEEFERRQLAKEKSYEVLDYLDDFEQRFNDVVRGDSIIGSTAPSIFVGRSNYPTVSTGILSPVGFEEDAANFETSRQWYADGLDIPDILQYRTGLLNSNRSTNIDVHEVWDGFVGVQREVAIADQPVDVEIGLTDTVDLDIGLDDIATPTGPRARAKSAELTENPSVPLDVKKTLKDDDWRAEGAMTYLYRNGFDVYDINTILSAGALGEKPNRRLVPTRWSITAVDDTLGKYLRGKIKTNQSIDTPAVWINEYIGNRYWVVLAPGRWEFELVEMKSPGSIWNPDREGDTWIASAHEGFTGRTGYVEETAGAYYASRLGVLEYLDSIDRQAKCLVIREVSDDYWAPVGVWQVRESVRGAFEEEAGLVESFHEAIQTITPNLPVSYQDIQRKSSMVAGMQSQLQQFTGE